MRIRPGINPTPIVSAPAMQMKTETPSSEAPVTTAAPLIETKPLTIDLGDKRIELQPGEMAKVVDKLNETAKIFNYQLEFQMHEGSKITVKVIDTASGQIVREIPPERAMEAFNRMEAALGLLLDVRL